MSGIQFTSTTDTALLTATCPGCGEPMRLARVEPHDARDADMIIYDCECGAALSHTVDRAR
jgi:hypothetical protein